jgi:hypothetical protein
LDACSISARVSLTLTPQETPAGDKATGKPFDARFSGQRADEADAREEHKLLRAGLERFEAQAQM